MTNISSGLCFITPHYRPDGGISHLSYKTRLISGIINSDNCDIGYFDVDAKGNIWFAATQEGLFKYEKAQRPLHTVQGAHGRPPQPDKQPHLHHPR